VLAGPSPPNRGPFVGRPVDVEWALSFAHSTLAEVMAERAEVSTALAFRVAKVLDVSLHHVLSGEALPAGTCRNCGHPSDR